MKALTCAKWLNGQRKFLTIAAALLLTLAAAAEGKCGTPALGETAITVRGMVCGSCSAAVEKALTGMAGVIKAGADFKTDQVLVTYDRAIVTPQQMVEKIRKAGYRAELPRQPALDPQRR